MAGADKIGIVMATMIEARPFIENLGLINESISPFHVYTKENLYLIITGIGKTCCASAVTYLINVFNVEILYNFGAAGDLNGKYKIGDIIHIDSIIEPDRPHISGKKRIITPEFYEDFLKASLSTQDRPAVSDSERKNAGLEADIADMEGASFIQVCHIFKKKGYLFKIVTDIPGNDSDKDIIKNVQKTASILYNFFFEKIYKFYFI
jgi:adenosylhomocysteine nucleosidase